MTAALDTIALSLTRGLLRRLAATKQTWFVFGWLGLSVLSSAVIAATFVVGLFFWVLVLAVGLGPSASDPVEDLCVESYNIVHPLAVHKQSFLYEVPLSRRMTLGLIAPDRQGDCLSNAALYRFAVRAFKYQDELATSEAQALHTYLTQRTSLINVIQSRGFVLSRDFLLLIVPALLSTILFMTVLLGATVLVISKPITRKPLSLVLERLADSPENVGVFTVITAALSGLVILAKALQEALK
jgi:hypothetical protein